MVTLGERLGLPRRTSSLLEKAKRAGLDSAERLENLAVARGCWHYRTGRLAPVADVPETNFSNEELAVALLSPCLPYSPHTIRLGAAMLGAEDNQAQSLARLSVAEGAGPVLHYVACAGRGFEPGNMFWKELLELLPSRPTVPEGILPHPTRFVSMTGFTRHGPGRLVIWIRPRAELAGAHG